MLTLLLGVLLIFTTAYSISSSKYMFFMMSLIQLILIIIVKFKM